MSVVLYSYTLCVLVLFGKMLAISCYQGFYRIGRMTFKNAEDARLVGRAASAEELPQVARASQAWSNDLENIPLFFVLGGLYVALDGPAGPAPWLFGAFTVARIMHTVTYLGHWQPWRTLSYAVGTICLLWLAGLITTQLVTSSR
ncbi:MAPEG family protein [Pseudomonas sp. S60]|uniref:MAPEG family protein n=1 Tax=Pseudomonas sp. S60 TaxID=211124 RepID=UPI00191480B5|nr:MAPEG family protein [Pseudomonas sp. S60]MBK5011010.1 MAPEG family protein [Pseudomonas sp. S60]